MKLKHKRHSQIAMPTEERTEPIMAFKLPTEVSPPVAELGRMTALLYGQSKIGKTTFCAAAPGALILATEPGVNHVSSYKAPVGSWQELLEACGALAKGDHPYKTIVIDTVDQAYLMCRRFVCEKAGIQDPADLDFGKGHALVNNEFLRVLTKMAQLPFGLFLISHSQDVTVKTKGVEFVKQAPTLSSKSRQIVLGLVDLVLFCDIEVKKDESGYTETRMIRTKPTASYEAGDRTGLLPESIPLNYQAFAMAWAMAKAKQTLATPKAIAALDKAMAPQPVNDADLIGETVLKEPVTPETASQTTTATPAKTAKSK